MRTHTPVTSDAIGRGQRRGAGVEKVRAELVALARVLVRHGRARVVVGPERLIRAPVDLELVEACARELERASSRATSEM